MATATTRLMQHIANAVHEVPFFIKYRDHWRRKGKFINGMLELIRCYYADICVVRIPTGGRRYMLINDQVNKLHHRICQQLRTCRSLQSTTRTCYRTPTSSIRTCKLVLIIFTTKEDQQFNFVQVALKKQPQSLGILVITSWASQQTYEMSPVIRNGPVLFHKLSHMVASSIFVDCTRQRRDASAGIDAVSKAVCLINYDLAE